MLQILSTLLFVGVVAIFDNIVLLAAGGGVVVVAVASIFRHFCVLAMSAHEFAVPWDWFSFVEVSAMVAI